MPSDPPTSSFSPSPPFSWDGISAGEEAAAAAAVRRQAPSAPGALQPPSIVPLQLITAGSGIYYTAPVQLGTTKFNLQVDTGSSDLWVTGSTCTSAACGGVPSYNPLASDTAHDANMGFSIQYVVGSVLGEIYWEKMLFGGRTVERQAMAACHSVVDEDMRGGSFSGIIGLALPGNSIITSNMPGLPDNLGPLSNIGRVKSNTSASKRRRRTHRALPEISPPASSSSSPLLPRAQSNPTALPLTTPFISLALARPSDPRVISQLGLNSHLNSVCDDACVAALKWTKVVESLTGMPLFWRSPIQGLRVTNPDGSSAKLDIGGSTIVGQAWPVGIFDSGAMGIYTSNRDLLNAIYGSIGVGPGKDDGQYYMPCTTALRITIDMSIGSFPIHPLDVSDFISNDPSHMTCKGILQWIDPSQLVDKGDIVLGSSFMRNVYTVMSGPDYNSRSQWTTPQLSMLPLTNSSTANEEFYRVRVLKQNIIIPVPTDSSSSGQGSSQASSSGDNSARGSSLGAGAIAGVAVAGVVFAVLAVFLGRFFVVRRHMKNAAGEAKIGSGSSSITAVATGGRPGSGNGGGAVYTAAPSSPSTGLTDSTTKLGFLREQGRINSYRSGDSSTCYSDDDENMSFRNGKTRYSHKLSCSGSGGSMLGGGYDDLSADIGLAGTPAGLPDDSEDPFFYEKGDPALDSDGVSMLNRSWRISERRESVSSLSAADSLLLARREARRSRAASAHGLVADRASTLSSITVSSSSTLHPGMASPQHAHTYPPAVTSPTPSHPSLPSSPGGPANHRPSLFLLATNNIPPAIAESPATSPATRQEPTLSGPSLARSPSPPAPLPFQVDPSSLGQDRLTLASEPELLFGAGDSSSTPPRASHPGRPDSSGSSHFIEGA